MHAWPYMFFDTTEWPSWPTKDQCIQEMECDSRGTNDGRCIRRHMQQAMRMTRAFPACLNVTVAVGLKAGSMKCKLVLYIQVHALPYRFFDTTEWPSWPTKDQCIHDMDCDNQGTSDGPSFDLSGGAMVSKEGSFIPPQVLLAFPIPHCFRRSLNVITTTATATAKVLSPSRLDERPGLPLASSIIHMAMCAALPMTCR